MSAVECWSETAWRGGSWQASMPDKPFSKAPETTQRMTTTGAVWCWNWNGKRMNKALVLILTATLLSGCAQLESWRGSSETARGSEPSRVTSRVPPVAAAPAPAEAAAKEDDTATSLLFPGTDMVVNMPL